VLMPGETGAYEVLLDQPAPIARIDVRPIFGSHSYGDVQVVSVENTSLRRIDSSYGGVAHFQFTGQVRNDSGRPVGIFVQVWFLDSQGRVLEVQHTVATDVASGTKAPFDVSTLSTDTDPQIGGITQVKVHASTY
jgi:hypothetical protein